MFNIEYRDRVRDYILQLAKSDGRITAGAVVGSLALSDGDRWSDLDLTFGVSDNFSKLDVLEDWTSNIAKEFDAIHILRRYGGNRWADVHIKPWPAATPPR